VLGEAVGGLPTYGAGVIVLIATYRGKPGTGATIEPLLAELAAATRDEPGCLLYLVNRSTTAVDTFVLYEHYVDDDALAAHRDSPHFQRLAVGHVIPMLEERVFDVYHLVEDPPS
jgi:quinol monooxygenase YgiN